MHIPSKRRARGSAFTVIEVLVVIMIFAIAAALAIPTIVARKEKTHKAQCRSNLLAIEARKLPYVEGIKAGLTNNLVPTTLEKLYAGDDGRFIPHCPTQKGMYTIGSESEKPSCSILGHTL